MSETQQQLDTEISTLASDVATLGTTLTAAAAANKQALADLKARIAAAPTPIDFTAEIAQLETADAAIQAAATAANAIGAASTAADPATPAAAPAAPATTTAS